MGKENFDRYSLKNNFMKQVLFRLDYKGVLDIKKIVEVFQEKHKSKFVTFETAYHNHVDVELTNINDISDTLSIPVPCQAQQISAKTARFKPYSYQYQT